MRRVVLACVLVALAATSAAAQELSAGLSLYRSFGLNDLDGSLPPAVELRVSVPVSERFWAEPFAAIGRDSHFDNVGLVGVRIRQDLAAFHSERRRVFASYGVACLYADSSVSPPYVGLIGIGVSQRVIGALHARGEVQALTFHVVPIGVRAFAGLTVVLWHR